MSGPKVVRIVTREEVMAICNAHLARLDAAISGFERFCRARNLATEDELMALQGRRLEMQKLLAEEKFLELQKRVPDEIERIAKDRDFRVKKAAEKSASKAAALKRARSLARALLTAEKGFAADLIADLKAIESGTGADVEAVNSILSRAYAQKLEGQSDGERDDLERAAAPLADHTIIFRLDEWAKHQPEPDDSEEAELLNLISALGLEEGEARATQFRDRFAMVGEANDGVRKMRRDSLMMEVKQALLAAKEEQANRVALEALGAEWATFSTAAAPWTLSANADPAALTEAVAGAQKAVDAERQRVQAQWRRDAVLKELGALGYEVYEGLKTALAKDGKVVLRKAAMPDYGVEVVAPDKGERIAFRAVGLGDAWTVRDRVRDTEAETLWCSDFERLNETIKMHAGHVVIEKAVPAGAEPLKVVEHSISDAPAVEIERPTISAKRT